MVFSNNRVHKSFGPDPRTPEKANINFPEIILTEAYKLSFEGGENSYAVSDDRLILKLPQRTPLYSSKSNLQVAPIVHRENLAVAILTGPHAGTSIRISATLDNQQCYLARRLPEDAGDISIVSGYFNATFRDNIIDVSQNGEVNPRARAIVLPGGVFSPRLIKNEFRGAQVGTEIAAFPAEGLEYLFGWTRTPVFGAVIEKNSFWNIPLPLLLHASPDEGNQRRPSERTYLFVPEITGNCIFNNSNHLSPRFSVGGVYSYDQAVHSVASHPPSTVHALFGVRSRGNGLPEILPNKVFLPNSGIGSSQAMTHGWIGSATISSVELPPRRGDIHGENVASTSKRRVSG